MIPTLLSCFFVKKAPPFPAPPMHYRYTSRVIRALMSFINAIFSSK